jgi:hypothetical protein
MVTRKQACAKREHVLVFTMKLAGRHNFDEASVPPQLPAAMNQSRREQADLTDIIACLRTLPPLQ